MSADLPLPRWAHRPGSGSRPDRQFQIAILAHAARIAGALVGADHALVRHGLRLNDEGFFWESHDVLEAVWKAAPKGGLDRLMLRGCIQIANANLKAACGRPKSADRLLAEAMAEFAEVHRRGTPPAGSFAAAFDAARLGVGQRPMPILLQRGWT